MKLTNREKVLLPAALLIIAAALFINFIYLPLNKKIKTLNMQVTENDIQISGEETKLKSVQGLEDRLAKAREAFDSEHSDIPERWDQPQLLVFVENTIDPLCVKTSVNFFDRVTVQGIQAGEINIVFNSDYTSLKKILEKFEEAQYYNNITLMDIHEPEAAAVSEGSNEAELGNTAQAEQEKQLEVSMNIRFYSKNQNSGYPEDYSFMDGDYGKTKIFE